MKVLALLLCLNPSWVLTYWRVDNSKKESRAFCTKQQAINWINGYNLFDAETLTHGDKKLSCWTSWSGKDDRRDGKKSVDCDTEENLQKKYCLHGCVVSGK
jgi:hypothetical protein